MDEFPLLQDVDRTVLMCMKVRKSKANNLFSTDIPFCVGISAVAISIGAVTCSMSLIIYDTINESVVIFTFPVRKRKECHSV